MTQPTRPRPRKPLSPLPGNLSEPDGGDAAGPETVAAPRQPRKAGRPKAPATAADGAIVSNAVSISEAGRILDVDRTTIHNWLNKAPYLRKPDGRVVVSEITKWREDQAAAKAKVEAIGGADIDDLDRKIKEVELRTKQLKLDVELGKFVLVQDALFHIQDVFATLRTQVLTIAPRAAPQVADSADTGECERIIAGYVAEVLNDLAGKRFEVRNADS